MRHARYAIVPLLLLVLGCHSSDSQRVEVHGRVTYQGNPVQHGSIVFHPSRDGKGPAAGVAITNGKYSLSADRGPTTGPHDVELKFLDLSQSKQEPSPTPARNLGDLVTFSQHVDIKRGPNQIDFALTPEPPPAKKSQAESQ